MITPIRPIMPPAITYDGIWLRNISIFAPSTGQPVRGVFSVCPYSSASGSLCVSQTKQIVIPDIYALAASNSYIATAMENIYAYVQSCVTSGSISF